MILLTCRKTFQPRFAEQAFCFWRWYSRQIGNGHSRVLATPANDLFLDAATFHEARAACSSLDRNLKPVAHARHRSMSAFVLLFEPERSG